MTKYFLGSFEKTVPATKKAFVVLFTEKTTYLSAPIVADGKVTAERVRALADALEGVRDESAFAEACAAARRALGARDRAASAYTARPTASAIRDGMVDCRWHWSAFENATVVFMNATGAELTIVAKRPGSKLDAVAARFPDGSAAALVRRAFVGGDAEPEAPTEGTIAVPVVLRSCAAYEGRNGEIVRAGANDVAMAHVPTIAESDMKPAYRVENAARWFQEPFELVLRSYAGRLWAPASFVERTPDFESWRRKYVGPLQDGLLSNTSRWFELNAHPETWTRIDMTPEERAYADAERAMRIGETERFLVVVSDDGKKTTVMEEADVPTYYVSYHEDIRPYLAWTKISFDAFFMPLEVLGADAATFAAGEKDLLVAAAKAKGMSDSWIREAEVLSDVEVLDPDAGAFAEARPRMSEIAPGVVALTDVADDPEVKAAVARWIAQGAVPVAWASTLERVVRRFEIAGFASTEALETLFDPSKCLKLPKGAGILFAKSAFADA